MTVHRVSGDLLSGDYEAIAHQCNCVSRTGAGLYLDVIEIYPQASIYAGRVRPARPGTIVFTDPVISLMSQYYPGRPAAPDRDFDTPSQRLEWFNQALALIPALGVREVAFPYKIGCGLAQGHWPDYRRAIRAFARANRTIDVYIVKKEE